MTKTQVRTKFKKLQKENRKTENDLLEKALKCGALNLENYEDDFMVPKMIMFAICFRLADGWTLHTKETREDAENLRRFI